MNCDRADLVSRRGCESMDCFDGTKEQAEVIGRDGGTDREG